MRRLVARVVHLFHTNGRRRFSTQRQVQLKVTGSDVHTLLLLLLLLLLAGNFTFVRFTVSRR